jgi:radical SAM superfamily enzyme
MLIAPMASTIRNKMDNLVRIVPPCKITAVALHQLHVVKGTVMTTLAQVGTAIAQNMQPDN